MKSEVTWIYCFLVCILLSVHMCVCVEVNCPPCGKLHCNPKKASKLTCKGGVTTGICDCCPTCAKILGESCGGDYNYLGKCDKGLFCEPISSQKVTYVHRRQEPEGVCKPVPIHVRDQPAKERHSCRPKCTFKYCNRRPRAICSATDVADVLQPCQGKCQHTSCRACELVRQPSCRKCAENDFRCMKRFGKCMKSQVCSYVYPCKSNNRIVEKEPEGKFQCYVPECPRGDNP